MEEKLSISNANSSSLLLVDIGGNVGHDLVNFQAKFPNPPVKLLLEDLAQVVASAHNSPSGIEAIGHDFFQTQPLTIHNAKGYYLRNVLYDWPDEQAKNILENVREVMSILLIDENALINRNVAMYPATLDMIMMCVIASLNWTDPQFEELLDSAGFELVATLRSKEYVPGAGTLFKAVLKK